jgi:DNA-binding MarR family transcriptional regulator
MSGSATALRPLAPRLLDRAGESAIQEQCRRLAEWLAAWRSFLAVNEAILVDADLTPQEFAALLEVDRSDVAHGPTIGMLAMCLQTRHNTTVGLVTRMCNKGYVRRVRDTQDRRQTHVQLTDSGRHILTALVRAHCRELDEIRTELAPVTAA